MQRNLSNQRVSANSYLEKNRTREESRSRVRGMVLIAVFAVLLPPLGLLLAWKSRRVGSLMRIALSVVGMASMTLIFCLMLSGDADPGILPVPVVPDHAGYDQSVSAATNAPVDVLPEDAGSSGYVVTYGDGTMDDLSGDLPLDPALSVTIVYAVTNNATYYHMQQVCELQTNSRVLTLDDAVAEGLLPCAKCAGGEEPVG